MKTALVTSIGSVAADIVIKRLKQHGFRVVGCDIYPKEWIADANNVDAFYQAPYVSETEKYLSFIHEVCEKEKVQYVLPLIDLEVDLFNIRREWFEQNQIVLCISPQKALDVIRNKKVLADFISERCPYIQTIPTVMIRDVKDSPWEFPVVCKPYNGRSSQGVKYVHNQQKWDEFIRIADKEVYIVQPYIKGSIVMVEMIRQENPHKVIAIVRRELLSTAHGCGTTVYMYQDLELEEKCRKMADELGILGCVNFEFILDENGLYHFVECNPRFSAGCEFSCMSGYDCVGNHIRCFEGKEIEDYRFTHCQYIARKYEEYITRIE